MTDFCAPTTYTNYSSTYVDHLYAYDPDNCSNDWSCLVEVNYGPQICISPSLDDALHECEITAGTADGVLTKEVLYCLTKGKVYTAGDICVAADLVDTTNLKFFTNQDNCNNACQNKDDFTPSTNEVTLLGCPPIYPQ